MKKIIISMTTVPSRQKRLEENIQSILEQTQNFDKFVINIDDNLQQEDIDWYNHLMNLDDRIEINISDHKWRSCNKLLPTIKKYPDDIIITIDDDVYYPKQCFEKLVETYIHFPNCIIAHEINPITVNYDNNYVGYINGIDIKLNQVQYGKYLSNCALFPPHVFDGSYLFDYDKMMKYTQGTHDELWFWLNSTLNGIRVIGLDYIFTFHTDNKTPWKENEYRLANINCSNERLIEYMDTINADFGEKLCSVIKNNQVEFFVTPYNIQLIIAFSNQIKQLYNYGIKLNIDKSITSGWLNVLYNTYNINESI